MENRSRALPNIVRTRPPTVFQVKMKRDRFFAERRVLQDGAQVWSATDIDTDTDVGSNSGSSTRSRGVVDVNVHGAQWDGSLMGAMGYLRVDSLATSMCQLAEGIADGIVSAGSNAAPSLFSLVAGHSALHSTRTGGLRRPGKRKNGPSCVCNTAPSLHARAASVCSVGAKHFGRPRVFFDPVEQRWWCWWTCCGQGEMACDPK
jgi:hypothetical protein